MTKLIQVGNLALDATEENVEELFAQYGTVHIVELITDEEDEAPLGYGLVEMDDDEAEAAIEALNGVTFLGRRIQVREATGAIERPYRERHRGDVRRGVPRRDSSFRDELPWTERRRVKDRRQDIRRSVRNERSERSERNDRSRGDQAR